MAHQPGDILRAIAVAISLNSYIADGAFTVKGFNHNALNKRSII
ncbi:hypothetical protein BN128_3423 [Cronobacter sakazakii 696]|nr:hypothetical protein BN129_2522 [Cronobacter sakazakii 701]CCK05647.1 hypothetical protein BN128_3423 [Cronobacter sakazakii 696]